MTALFDPLGPLPTGVTMLEASAGTGKTHTVGALVARYVAEGVCPLDRLLVITFGRAASQELRERVRAQLVAVAAALDDPTAARAADGLIGCLAAVDDAELAVRRRRVLDALASFDAATIATTHQFCHVVLRSLGVAGDSDPDVTLVDDLDDLVVEVVDDVYLRLFGQLATPPFGRALALSLARTVVGDPHTEITPTDPEIGSASQERVRFALEVRAEVDRRKHQRGIISFDDLLERLDVALGDDASPARERMRARWSVVLVDEFQDTDPVQWSVLERAFGPSSPSAVTDPTMVLIGDPKQAIYAFRGGDIDSYLAAVRQARDRRTLGTNHRSDGPLVDALQVLTRGAELGDPSIVVLPVEAARATTRLAGAPHPDPVRVRVVDYGDDERPAPIAQVRETIAADLAAEVAALLTSGATYDDGSATRPLGAGDVAVLMRSLAQAGPIAAALAEHGVPCVVGDRDSVLSSEAAGQWLTLLEALERPTAERVRAAALTSFVGVAPTELDAGGDDLTDQLADQVRDLLDVFRQRGIAAVQEATIGAGLAARVLARPSGERLLTDLEHVGELLHGVGHGRRPGIAALAGWLREERRAASTDTSPAERQRRLDTDASAVQLLTIHASKGLQYPVVLLPHAFDRWIQDVDREVAVRHHVPGDHGAERMLEIGRPLDRAAVATSRAEDAGEELRLTYVALTRAQSQVVAWWGRTANAGNSGLTRLLLGRGPDEAVVPASIAVPTVADARRQLTRWADAGGLTVEDVGPAGTVTVPTSADVQPLQVRTLTRSLDTDWRRTSYTGLIRAAEGAVTTTVSEPEVVGTIDEDQPDEESDDVTVRIGTETGPASPMSELPAGPGFGSLVHAVLELADPQAPDLEAELARVVTEQLRWWPADATVDELVAGLLPLHDTPLGDVAAGATLRQIGLADRLCELDFEMPLAGGDHPDDSQAEVHLGRIADVLRRHLPADDLLVDYPDHLGGPLGEQALRGYLGGSIDAVLRVGPAGAQRFVVVDYKTNRLGVPERPLTALDYTPQAMAASMTHSHYPLQALLYSVVLHRYLRWRLPDYDPTRHLGGIAYLYLRGMVGADTPVVDGMPCGVFTWRPPAAAVVELSDLLAGGGAA